MTIPWFKCYPAPLLNRLAELDPDPALVYVICLLRMYDEDGPISNDAEKIGRRANMTKGRARRALDILIGNGVLVLNEYGELTKEKVEKEIKNRSKISQKNSEAAKKKWEKPNEINETALRAQCARNANAMPHRLQTIDTNKEQGLASPRKGGRRTRPSGTDAISLAHEITTDYDAMCRLLWDDGRAPALNEKDHATALRWIQAGCTVEGATEAMRQNLVRRRDKGEDPPTRLSYFTKPVLAMLNGR